MSSPVEMTELYDNALLGILQHVGNIQNFLQVYFGFLYRKTDFYRLLSGPHDRMGFPPGVAEKMVFKTFKLFEKLAEQDRERAARLSEETKSAPPALQELEVQSEQEAEAPVEEMRSTEEPTPVTIPLEPNTEAGRETPHSSTAEATGETQTAATTVSSNTDSSKAKAGQDSFQSNPDSYNGAIRDNYTWSQDYTDVEVRVHVQPNIVKGRQLSLSKTGEVWWSAVLKGETEIDVNQINRERSMATVDEEEHAVLDRLSFDYHQKLQGKPQSHEMKVHEMLKKGWDAEGSPFKGQEFDPSMFNIPPSAVQF
ncbi:nudC domain-containing protein 3-like isoform X2 [Myxocyprinus asiaticus]|uniref:nudC domain-containing protein 3-like isoform X2 n=1 Tax=Myxocyprinus asiaticus TaxID=70543 RepID=UPI0022217D9F|nr:nudC domain-containing protein 3-like isoform X2 [Myxocyprinus asiaticus]